MSNIRFDTLDDNGQLVKTRTMRMSDIKNCPRFILLVSHYREDGSCRCNEVTCEADDCAFLKYHDEIYCEYHLKELFGLTAEDLEDE